MRHLHHSRFWHKSILVLSLTTLTLLFAAASCEIPKNEDIQQCIGFDPHVELIEVTIVPEAQPEITYRTLNNNRMTFYRDELSLSPPYEENCGFREASCACDNTFFVRYRNPSSSILIANRIWSLYNPKVSVPISEDSSYEYNIYIGNDPDNRDELVSRGAANTTQVIADELVHNRTINGVPYDSIYVVYNEGDTLTPLDSLYIRYGEGMIAFWTGETVWVRE